MINIQKIKLRDRCISESKMIVKFLSFLNSFFLLLALSAVQKTIQDKTRFHYYDDSDDIKIE